MNNIFFVILLLILKLFLCCFFIDLDIIFEFFQQFFSIDSLQMADPMFRDDDDPNRRNDDSDEEQIGSPGKLPPKPGYQRVSAEVGATGILFGLLGIAIGIVIIVSNIADPGQGPQNPPPINPQDGFRPPLAGGSANAEDPMAGSDPDGGSGGE